MLLLIDNYDSFTYNIVHQLENLGKEVTVRNRETLTVTSILENLPQSIIIGPGPGTVQEIPFLIELIQAKPACPILGICLGHQALGYAFGAPIVPAKAILHGKTSLIEHREHFLFRGLESPFTAARYHSLALGELPIDLELLAHSEGEIMAIGHRELPYYGVQFHPDSFMTPNGERILKNFL